MPNAYEVLGVPDACDDDRQIKVAYHKLAMQNHPDKVPEEQKEAAQEQMTKINEAYEAIKTADARRAYKMLQEANIQFQSGDYPISIAQKQFDISRKRDKAAMFRRWVKQSQMTQWFMDVGSRLFGPLYSGSLRFARLSQVIDFSMILDVLYKDAQNHMMETITVSVPIDLYAPVQITAPAQLLERFPGLPEDAAQQIFPEIGKLNPPLDGVAVTPTESTITLNENDVQITEAQMEAMQTHLMFRCMREQIKAQCDFMQTHNVQSSDVADVQMGFRQDQSKISVIECPCVIQQYTFKGQTGWVCAELSSGAMCGTYQMSKVKLAIVGTIAAALFKNSQE